MVASVASKEVPSGMVTNIRNQFLSSKGDNSDFNCEPKKKIATPETKSITKAHHLFCKKLVTEFLNQLSNPTKNGSDQI